MTTSGNESAARLCSLAHWKETHYQWRYMGTNNGITDTAFMLKVAAVVSEALY